MCCGGKKSGESTSTSYSRKFSERSLRHCYLQNENKISFTVRFPFTRRSENSRPFEKHKVHTNFAFVNCYIHLFFKIEKRKSATDFRFSRGRKTNGPLILIDWENSLSSQLGVCLTDTTAI